LNPPEKPKATIKNRRRKRMGGWVRTCKIQKKKRQTFAN